MLTVGLLLEYWTCQDTGQDAGQDEELFEAPHGEARVESRNVKKESLIVVHH